MNNSPEYNWVTQQISKNTQENQFSPVMMTEHSLFIKVIMWDERLEIPLFQVENEAWVLGLQPGFSSWLPDSWEGTSAPLGLENERWTEKFDSFQISFLPLCGFFSAFLISLVETVLADFLLSDRWQD